MTRKQQVVATLQRNGYDCVSITPATTVMQHPRDERGQRKVFVGRTGEVRVGPNQREAFNFTRQFRRDFLQRNRAERVAGNLITPSSHLVRR